MVVIQSGSHGTRILDSHVTWPQGHGKILVSDKLTTISSYLLAGNACTWHLYWKLEIPMAGTRNKSCFGQHRPKFEIFLSFSTTFLPLISLTKIVSIQWCVTRNLAIAIVSMSRNVSENTFKFILISQFTIFTIPTVDSIGKHDVTQVLDLIKWVYCGMKTILTYLKHQYLNPAGSFAKTTSCLYHPLKQIYLHVSDLFTPNFIIIP